MVEKPAGEDDEGLPRYLKVVLVIVGLVLLFILVIDLLTFAAAL